MIVSAVDTVYQVYADSMKVTNYKTLLDEDLNKTYTKITSYEVDIYNAKGEITRLQPSGSLVDISA